MQLLKTAREGNRELQSSDRQHFLDTLRDGVVVFGPDLRIVLYNANYLSQFELDDGDVAVGDRLEDVLRLLARKNKLGALDGQSVDEAVAQRMAAWRRGEARVERRVLDTGRVLDIYRTPTIHDEMVAVHVDVTSSVLAEQELERQRLYMKVLLQNVSDGTNLLDRHGRFVVFNDRFPQLYGIDPALISWGIPYRTFAEYMADMDGLSPEQRRAEIALRERFALDPNTTHCRRNLGDGRSLDIQKANLPDGGCVMTMRDVTDEIRREKELLKALNLAEETTRHRADFVARMSHEMRTPLNGILGVAALLGQSSVDERQREMLNVIVDSGRVLLRLFDDILDLSRLDAEPFDVVVDDVDIFALLEKCVGIIGPGAGEKGLTVLLRPPPEPIPRVRGDMVRIKQIVLNLLTNAVKFTDRGRVEVAPKASPTREGVRLFIRVADTGVGIPADKLDCIFDSFYQIDSIAARKYGGAGLGLAITQKLVEAMGGTINVSSELGVGSIFSVQLTLPPAEPAAGSR